jgi:hypothetical protein
MANLDLQLRSADIHWPDGHTPLDADVFAHNDIVICAPRGVVWHNIIAAQAWPQWYPNSQNVKVIGTDSGLLQAGSQFAWTTFGLPIASTVSEYIEGSRIGWFGTGDGLLAYHTWLLADIPDGCYVVMEEAVKGPGAVTMHRTDPDGMHRGHRLWNEALKWISETGESRGPFPSGDH